MPRRNFRSTKSPQSSRTNHTQTHSSLSERERVTRNRALALLSDLRREEARYTKLLKKHHLTSRTARKWLGRDLTGGSRGRRVRASKSDRRVRVLLFPMPFGDLPIRTRSSHQATEISRFFLDRERLLGNKMSADEFETKWRGVRIAGQEVFADAATIFLRADAGDLKVERLYASTGGAR